MIESGHFLLITIPIVALFFCFNTLPLIKGVILIVLPILKDSGSYDWVRASQL